MYGDRQGVVHKANGRGSHTSKIFIPTRTHAFPIFCRIKIKAMAQVKTSVRSVSF